MNFANSQLFLPLFFFFFAISPFHALGQQTDWNSEETQHRNGVGRRVLLSFKEKPSGSNVTFECAPSGPCIPCLYSEKGDTKYRCSETGYRIPFKCVEMIKDSTKDAKKTKSHKGRLALEISDGIAESQKVSDVAGEIDRSQSHRRLVDDSSSSDNSSQAYITYRSCITPVNEEKLSVLNFEGVVIFLLLVSGSIIYLRKKKAASMSGYAAGRGQNNSRF